MAGRTLSYQSRLILQRAGRQIQDLVVKRAKGNFRRLTGRLGASFYSPPPSVRGTRLTVEVEVGGPDVPEAVALEYGTGMYTTYPGAIRRPIVIVPKVARVLRFPRRGFSTRTGTPFGIQGNLYAKYAGRDNFRPYIFAMRVVQLGQPPRPFLAPAVKETSAQAEQILAEATATIAEDETTKLFVAAGVVTNQ